MPSEADRPPGGDDACGRLRTLFDAALQQPAALRQAWISAQVADDAECTRLLRLLAADERASGALDTPVAERAARIGTGEDDPGNEASAAGLVGQRIGAFRLVQVLGQGGMATVFLGQREGADFDQRVAVKLLRRGLYSQVEQRLFRRERRTLALLSHPNIAHLIDGGVTAAGIPYLVLEYIDGVPITHHANDMRLGLRARLRLFAVVCLAVDAAHRQLVVHRDLKPSNILVNAQGQVKLLDFGIAKLLDEEDGATRTGIAALTPGYAAPEQFVGGPVSTATDVYALGVLLHELLLGVRPGASTTRRPSSLIGRGHGPGQQPAAHTALRSALKGDLDNILLKAMAIEPARRYASAGALADDIQRHLDGRPVRAHPPSRGYRMGKFVFRHKTSVAAAVAVLLSLSFGLALTVWQAERAQRQAARATAVRDFVQTLFDPVGDGLAEGKMPGIRDLVSLGVERLDATPGLGPAERVDLLTLFSRLHENIGEMPRARALADAATRLADARLDPLDPLAIQALATRGFASTRLEDFVSAGKDLRLAHRRMQRIGLRGAPLIDVLDDLAAVENSEGSPDRVLLLARQALTERHATWGPRDGRLGPGYDNLGYALEGAARYDQAAAAWHTGYLINLRHKGRDSLITANSLQGEASSLWRAGRWRAAQERFVLTSEMLARVGGKPQFLHAVEAGKLCALEGGLANRAALLRCADARRITQQAYSRQHPIYADALVSSAIGLIELGDLDAARASLRQARGHYGSDRHDALRRGRLASELAAIALLDHQPRLARRLLATAASDLRSRAYWLLPLLADARRLLACSQAPGADCPPGLEAQVLAEADRRAPSGHPQLLVVDTILARVALQRGEAAAASRRLDDSMARARRELRADHPRILEARLWHAVASARRGDCAAVARERAEAVALQRTAFPAGHPFLADASAALDAGGACRSVTAPVAAPAIPAAAVR